MHGLLSIAASHDRYLGTQPSSRRSAREANHSYQCVVLFKRWLSTTSTPIIDQQKDVVWVTAVILAIMSFLSIDVASLKDTWPLNTSDDSALDWLRLKANDRALWHMADPLRPGSAFLAAMDTFKPHHRQMPTRGFDGIPEDLVNLCQLNASSTQNDNPYFIFAHALSHLLQMCDEEMTLGSIFYVVTQNSQQLLYLLQKRDPIALALLNRWYGRARGFGWWIDFRARHEMPAIHGLIG